MSYQPDPHSGVEPYLYEEMSVLDPENDRGWYLPGDEEIDLICIKCAKIFQEGFAVNEYTPEIYCSIKCFKADGHDPSTAFRTVTELGED